VFNKYYVYNVSTPLLTRQLRYQFGRNGGDGNGVDLPVNSLHTTNPIIAQWLADTGCI